MLSSAKNELERWASQLGGCTAQRKSAAARVKAGEYSFEEVKGRVASMERKLLQDQVRDGKMSPAKAEAKAQRLGCAPLIPVADPACHDLTNEPSWTVPMALAWIMWQTEEAVRRHSDTWRQQQLKWCRNDWGGHALQAAEGPSNFLVLRYDELIVQRPRNNAPRMSAEQAWLELRHQLRAGALSLDVIDPVTAAWRRVDEHEFSAMAINPCDAEVRLEPAGYTKPLLARDEVRKVWPVAGASPSAEGASHQTENSRCTVISAEQLWTLENPPLPRQQKLIWETLRPELEQNGPTIAKLGVKARNTILTERIEGGGKVFGLRSRPRTERSLSASRSTPSFAANRDIQQTAAIDGNRRSLRWRRQHQCAVMRTSKTKMAPRSTS